jgi:rare lipoprotein A
MKTVKSTKGYGLVFPGMVLHVLHDLHGKELSILRFGFISLRKQMSVLGICALLSACGSPPYRAEQGQVANPPNPRVIADAVPRVEPRSPRGNPESYIVLGKRYFVLPTSQGYTERGIASWYGKQFHGRNTSNGERYNMYAMSAAHKTLPLPTYVQVTNLTNGRKIVVRVNDRGPFHGERIIDLSYSAAEKLGMLGTGTALVEVKALGADGNPTTTVADTAAGWRDESHLQNRIFIQVGAFTVRYNAEKLLTTLLARFPSAEIRPAQEQSQLLHRVRIGPLSSVAATDQAVAQLQSLGLSDYRVVVE